MNQSAAADQSKTATEAPTTKYVVKLGTESLRLFQIGLIADTHNKPSPPSLASSSAALPSTSSPSPSTSVPLPPAVAVTADDLSVKYRTILEELLRLRIDLVTKSIRSAIKEVIVVEIAQTTSDDWLLVIFRAFERILEALDVSLIYSNDSYLVAISRLISRLIETSKLLELVESRSETRNFTKLCKGKMSGVLSQVSMEAVYKSAQEIFETKQRSSYAQILELLATSLTEWPAIPENALSPQRLSMWFNHVVPLIFDVDDDIQQNAINAVERMMPLLMISKHQLLPDWSRHRNVIITKYVKEIGALFQKDNARWHHTWCHCVRILDIEIPRSATTLNAFLGIVEPALRSVIPMRRAEGYLCWRVLLGVLVRHNRLNSEKRLKLACTPLKSLQAKTVEIASNKFQAWWYVLCNVVDNSAGYNSMVFEPFLQFCFGPLAAEPNIRSEIIETTAQVKRFPDVSLMAIATFVRILGEPTAQTTEIFKKYALDQIDRTICTEKQFQNSSLARLIINACGEATFMLTNLGDDSNNNVDCSGLASHLWRNLLAHVNHVKNHEHFILIVKNVKQLLVAGAKAQNDDRKEKTINLVKIILAMLAETNIDSSVYVVGLLEIITMLPIGQPNELLAKVVAVSPTAKCRIVHNYATVLHSNFFDVVANREREALNVPAEQVVRIKFRIWLKWFGAVQSWWSANKTAVERIKNLNGLVDAVMECLLWPLNVLIDNRESLLFARALNEMAQLISAAIGKKAFCQRSAKSMRRALELPQHCAHINNVVAVLFDFMNYDYNGIADAPVDVLDLCVALIKSEKKVSFQDLNPIALAIVDYYKSISKVQRSAIETKLREVMASIEKTKSEMRVDPMLVSAFHELIENGASSGGEALLTPKNNKHAADGSASESSKTRKSANSSEGDFVVVDKVWSLKPNRLTDHQKEKLKERRCDIPALYNNLSQSQDSVSLKEWTPKIQTTTATNVTAAVASVSAVAKSSVAVDGKNQDENVATNNTEHKSSSAGKCSDAPKVASASEPIVPKKLKFTEDGLSEDEEKKKRIERELSRIHIDAVVDAVPIGEGLARRTRSSRSTDERTPKRKLRNEPPTPAAKPTPKAIRTAPQAKVRQAKVDSEASDDVVQSSQPPKGHLPSVQRKRKFRIISVHEDEEPAPPIEEIEETTPTIATAIDVDIAPTIKQEDEPSVAMDTNENETELAKEEEIEIGEEMLATPPAVNDQEASVVDMDDGGDVAPADDDDSLEEPPSSPVTEGGSNVLGKSYMSLLEYNDTSANRSRDNPNESILTSPKIDDKKNAEFLNDTLNISPIVSDTEGTAAESMMSCSVLVDCTTVVTPKASSDHAARESFSNVDATTPIDPVRNSNESTLPEVAPQPKAFRSSQCSTPIQSNHSPISSKFKPQIMGRGAQLLKMININKNNQQQQQQQQQQKLCASPTMTMTAAYNETATILVSTTASPSINRLQTAPIHGANVSTPEPANETSKTTKSELLTFSRALPSPYESPRFSILKRKASKDGEDDSIHSPAHKRKRVSFNFPLTETVEFITDDEMAAICAAPNPTGAAPNTAAHREIDPLNIRSPAHVVKYKLKLKKRIENAKDAAQANHVKAIQSTESPAPSSSIALIGNKLFGDTNEDEVSVEHIKEILELDSSKHRKKQKKLSGESSKAVDTDTADASSDVAMPASSDNEASSMSAQATDALAILPTPTPPPITLSSFSDKEIFDHIFAKFNITEVFSKFEESKPQTVDTQMARFFSRKLSTIMATDASVKVTVLDELAEKHSTAFLDHAVTENLCSTICDRLMASSKDGIVDYVGDKTNSDPDFAASLLNRINATSLHNRIVSTSTPNEKHRLLMDIVAEMDPKDASANATVFELLSKAFVKFNFTVEQFHEFTKLHILKTIQDAGGGSVQTNQ